MLILLYMQQPIKTRENMSCSMTSPSSHLHTRPLNHSLSLSLACQISLHLLYVPASLHPLLHLYSQALTSLISSLILCSKHLPPSLPCLRDCCLCFESPQAGPLCIPATSPLQFSLPPSHLFLPAVKAHSLPPPPAAWSRGPLCQVPFD